MLNLKIFMLLWYNTHFCPSPPQHIFSKVDHAYECFVWKLCIVLGIQEFEFHFCSEEQR